METASKSGNETLLTFAFKEEGPPDYGTTPANKDEKPPSYYQALYDQVKDAKQSSSGFMDFIKRSITGIFSTVGFIIGLGIMAAIPIAMVTIGSLYINDCQAEKYIPIFLIVWGVFGIIKTISAMVQNILNRKRDNHENNLRGNIFDSIINIFLVAWFIAGNVWIYRTKNSFQDVDASAADYCDPVLYWFAFWITTIIYIVFAVVGCCCCCTVYLTLCLVETAVDVVENKVVEAEHKLQENKEEIKSDIKEEAKGLLDQAEEKIEDKVGEIADMPPEEHVDKVLDKTAEKVEDKIDEAVDKAEAKIDEAADKIKDRVEIAKEVAKAANSVR